MKIKIKNISKKFDSVIANDQINIEITSKKIHALLGENGAGKSTLVKIISGHYSPDSGEIFINDNKLDTGSTSSSIKNGIGILSQDPLDFQNLSIKESFIVGSKKFGENFRDKNIQNELFKAFKKYEIELSLDQKIRSLSIGERQQIELIRLLSDQMLKRKRLGRDVFMKGIKRNIQSFYNKKYSFNLYDLLKTYSSIINYF